MKVPQWILDILGTWGIASDVAIQKLAEIAAKHPEVGPKVDAIIAWIRTAGTNPALQTDQVLHTLQGIAIDIASGSTGTDPRAWEGGV